MRNHKVRVRAAECAGLEKMTISKEKVGVARGNGREIEGMVLSHLNRTLGWNPEAKMGLGSSTFPSGQEQKWLSRIQETKNGKRQIEARRWA